MASHTRSHYQSFTFTLMMGSSMWSWINSFSSDKNVLLHFCLYFKIFTKLLVIGSPAVAGTVLWNRVCPSIHPCFCPSFHLCPSVFLELYHLLFLNFGLVLETHMKLCVTGPDFPEKCFCSENWENGPKMGLDWIF